MNSSNPLDRFYRAIELAAQKLEDFTEKQHFLNTVYERFFQGYSVKVADTHGIVYTPQPIVDFMCASVVEVLQSEFGKSLGDREVQILDPCTGTGNFIVNLLNRISKKHLPRVYREQLFANEVMLLPYYIAALNIEHAYYELTGEYEPFEGLCFVDTLDLAEKKQRTFGFVSKDNAARVARQRKAPITVIIGNPPYNANQINENDNNKNRLYPEVDQRIRNTYVSDSRASLRAKSYDMYWRFLRWASDRLEKRDGVVCMITNNGFVNGIAADGLRKHIGRDFCRVFHLDLKGNARTSGERRKSEGGNVFRDAVRVGVGITVLIRHARRRKRTISYNAVGDRWTAEQKLQYVESARGVKGLRWKRMQADDDGHWNLAGAVAATKGAIPMADRKAGKDKRASGNAIFAKHCLGVSTNRDAVVYGFQSGELAGRIRGLCEFFNAERDRLRRQDRAVRNLDDFVDYKNIKWSETLKRRLSQGDYLKFTPNRIHDVAYRPFAAKKLYFDRTLVDRPSAFSRIFPNSNARSENRIIVISDIGHRAPGFSTLMQNRIADLHLCAGVDGHQCYPFNINDEDGTNRREYITNWALDQFRTHYKDKKIDKWAIFHYVYALLHHPGYRERFADNLKRELPRIPLAPDFAPFSRAGRDLAQLQFLDYESLDPWPLDWIEAPGVPLSYHVDKMKLTKDKSALIVNPSLTLAGIPPETFRYRLGNRSALDWVIDQYQISEDKRSGIRSDPNRADDEQYIVRLVGQVVR